MPENSKRNERMNQYAIWSRKNVLIEVCTGPVLLIHGLRHKQSSCRFDLRREREILCKSKHVRTNLHVNRRAMRPFDIRILYRLFPVFHFYRLLLYSWSHSVWLFACYLKTKPSWTEWNDASKIRRNVAIAGPCSRNVTSRHKYMIKMVEHVRSFNECTTADAFVFRFPFYSFIWYFAFVVVFMQSPLLNEWMSERTNEQENVWRTHELIRIFSTVSLLNMYQITLKCQTRNARTQKKKKRNKSVNYWVVHVM